MPHKHTRKGEDKATQDLPPTILAQPLPVSKSASTNGIFTTSLPSQNKRTLANNNKRKRNNKDTQDDTPKAFSRLLAFQRGEKLPKGLDDGVRQKTQKKSNKRTPSGNDTIPPRIARAGVAGHEKLDLKEQVKSSNPTAGITTTGQEKVKEKTIPTIRNGERMSEFSARVDAALPLSGLLNKTKGGKDPLGLKVGRTKTERKMHRMYKDWREEEERIQERRDEEREKAEEENEDAGVAGWETVKATTTSGKKGKKRKMLGEFDDGDDDPWAVVSRNRSEIKAGLHDVVLAPPVFSIVPKEKFKRPYEGVENVPNKSGSLKRREELGVVRRSVVEGYRAMMKTGRGGEAS